MRKALISLLALLLCTVMVASCNGASTGNGGTGGASLPNALDSELHGPGGNTAFGGDGDNGVGFPKAETLDIFGATGLSQYTIVYPARGTDWVKAAARNLQAALEAITGFKLTVKSDFEDEDDPSSLRKEREILIGETMRKDAYVIPEGYENFGIGYTTFVAPEKRLVMLAGSETGMYFAIRDFLYQFYGQDLEKVADKLPANLTRVSGSDIALTVDKDFKKLGTLASQHLPYIGAELKDYQIVYDGTYLEKRMAYIMYEGVKNATNVSLSLVPAYNVNASLPMIKVQTVASEPDPNNPNAPWVAPNEYRLDVSGTTITVLASNYSGFTAAGKNLKNNMNAYHFFDLVDAYSETGDYITAAAKGVREATKYANQRAGDHRVMFYNVLFHSSASFSVEEGGASYTIPTGERNLVQALMIAEYMPDVLGCQEFARDKRDQSTSVAGHTGTTDLVKLIEALGYVEAFDPRVRNAYPATDKFGNPVYIPGTDSGATTGTFEGNEVDREQISGTPLQGYGGGTTVTVDGKTFNTFWNHTPLFYNTNTTKMIHAEYYWYKYQWDMRTGSYVDPVTGMTINAPGHNNGNGDAASKSASWGVFESLETGERYVVITTHMCTRSDYIRWLQGKELVELVEKIKTEYGYDYPIFFGGDMNGMMAANQGEGSGNIWQFENAGFTSLQDKDVASDFTSKVGTSHGYPDMDPMIGMVTPRGHGENNCGYVSVGNDSIDKIYAINYADRAELKVFGVVVDDCTLSGSDHLPIFVDFNLKNTRNG